LERFLSPEEIQSLTFNVVMRGYARDEVQEFLNAVSAEIQRVEELADQAYRRAGEDIGDLLQRSKDIADKINTEAEAVAQATRAKAESDAARMRAEAEQDSTKLRADAEQYSTSMRSEAEKYSAGTRSDADGYAGRTRLEADNDARTRVNEADRRVRELEAEEGEVRARIDDLRANLQQLADKLSNLGLGTPRAEDATREPLTELAEDDDAEAPTFDLTLQGDRYG
jgi:DivIVA domain-containing protein